MRELTGSEKQASWAKTIREQMLPELQARVEHEEKVLAATRAAFEKNPDHDNRIALVGSIAIATRLRTVFDNLGELAEARFWIDSRDDSTTGIFSRAGRLMGRTHHEFKAQAEREVSELESTLKGQTL